MPMPSMPSEINVSAYYNEIDPQAAAWLRELIRQGEIADGEVDERSIEDILPNELAGFQQCHFFAGIGGWAEALRIAGWPDDRAVWTGSCPCQSFSAAGSRKGFADERHLWPAWFHLIEERRPSVIFGEQVDAAIKHGWLDLVQTDLEAVGYALGRAVVPAAGVGAPHGRHRLWFVADANGGYASAEGLQRGWQYGQQSQDRSASDMGDTDIARPQRREFGRNGADQRPAGTTSVASCLVEPESEQAWFSRLARERRKTGAFWSAADWIYCRDDKWRPVESGTFPLAHGLPARVGRLRGYGNAIVPEVAAQFIEAYASIGD